ncbi:hypothetical protein [Stieleria mannarensis]|uniref:hypothetical protein n=1 Tax=Stieleria mannarensis TaxID=2755585 RepID=UPI001603AFCD|nr:hypothetical protein [Rhodopirellula sp. JC639]
MTSNSADNPIKNDTGDSPIFDLMFPIDQTNHELIRGPVEIDCSGETYQWVGVVSLRITPSPRIIFSAKSTEFGFHERLAARFSGDQITKFRFMGKEIDGFYISLNSSNNQSEIEWVAKREPCFLLGDSTTQIATIKAALFNFPDVNGNRVDSEKRGGREVRINILELEHENLKAEIRSSFDSSRANGKSKLDDLPRFTHQLALSFDDGLEHAAEEFENRLSVVKDCLSFMSGKRVVPVCPTGLDSNGSTAFKGLSSPNRSPGWVPSCLREGNADGLREFFRCYLDTVRREVWQNSLHESVYWYLNANQTHRGIDAGIILSQAAMEVLSYTFAVNDKGLISDDGYKKLRASDKLRLLLKSIGVPTDIPAELKQIQNLVANDKNVKWIDLPHALTEIRNSLVHPDTKNREKFYSCIHDAYTGWLWCLELSILAICGYSGRYRNRLTATATWDSDPVPWS